MVLLPGAAKLELKPRLSFHIYIARTLKTSACLLLPTVHGKPWKAIL